MALIFPVHKGHREKVPCPLHAWGAVSYIRAMLNISQPYGQVRPMRCGTASLLFWL